MMEFVIKWIYFLKQRFQMKRRFFFFKCSWQYSWYYKALVFNSLHLSFNIKLHITAQAGHHFTAPCPELPLYIGAYIIVKIEWSLSKLSGNTCRKGWLLHWDNTMATFTRVYMRPYYVQYNAINCTYMCINACIRKKVDSWRLYFSYFFPIVSSNFSFIII